MEGDIGQSSCFFGDLPLVSGAVQKRLGFQGGNYLLQSWTGDDQDLLDSERCSTTTASC